jgi:hypothetical protein
MKLEKLAAISEIVSSIAIVVTLIYLAIQTQQNTAAIQGTVRQSMLSEDREALYELIEHPSLELRCNLTSEQDTQLRAYMIAFLRMRESHWLQFRSGVVDEATWRVYRQPLAGLIFDSEFGRSLWRTIRAGFDEGFARSADELLETTAVVPCE